MPATSLEPLQATSYARGQRYKKHHDVPSDGGGRGHKRRLKTIFAYLQADGLLASTVFAEAMGRAYACTRALEAQSCGITSMTSAGETRALNTVEQK